MTIAIYHKPFNLLGSSVVMYMYMLAQYGVNIDSDKLRREAFIEHVCIFIPFGTNLTYKDTFDNQLFLHFITVSDLSTN